MRSFRKIAGLALFAGLTCPSLAQDTLNKPAGTPQLFVNGRPVEGNLLIADGHYYVDVEDLAESLQGTVRYGGDRVSLSINTLKPPSTSTRKPAPPSSLNASTGDGSNIQGLSKDYQKAATIAMSSIQDWRDKAFAVVESTSYSSGKVYANRTAVDRASDALSKAALDVKLVKAEASLPADREVQKRLEIYLDAAKTHGQAQIDFAPHSTNQEMMSKMVSCGVALEKALDDGSSETFSEHPDHCPVD